MKDQLLYILIGGGLGSVCRYLISEYAPHFYTGEFPIGTFLANIIGCFVIGILAALIHTNSPLSPLLVTGFCGGFTTFSSFSKETFLFVKQKKVRLAITYVLSSTLLGITAVFVGFVIAGGRY